jgi:HSP20 family protein
MENKKRSFFERITGSMRADDDIEVEHQAAEQDKKNTNAWMEEENEEAELTVDVFQTSTDIFLQTMVAGVKPEDLDLTIGRDMITIKGKRENDQSVPDENYFTKELYWGKFSRTILLPQEVEPDQSDATEKHGLLTIKLQKVDKEKKANVKVKSI